MNEFWYFKDDPSKLFIKQQVLVDKSARKALVKWDGSCIEDGEKSLTNTAQHQREGSFNKNDQEMEDAELEAKDKAPALKQEETLENAQIDSSIVNEEASATAHATNTLPEYKAEWSFIDEED